MTFWQLIVSNKPLCSACIGWAVAQTLKTLLDLWYTKEFSVERLWGSGGMPSSHSATVCALAASSAWIFGLQSFEFAVSFILAVVVMHDAVGVRRETGKQAKLLNKILEQDFFVFTDVEDFQLKLKEFVGHTPLQVLMGAILGIVIGCLFSM